jgi:hypothetical protein
MTSTRHSFRPSLNSDDNVSKNKFGHTVVGSLEEQKGEEEEQSVDFFFHPSRGVQVQSGVQLVEVLQNMLKSMANEPDDNPRKQEIIQQIESITGNSMKLDELVTGENVEFDPSVMEVSFDNSSFIDKVLSIEEQDSGECSDDILIDSPLVPILSIGKGKSEKTQRDSAKKCIRCSIIISEVANFCSECGASQTKKFCSECGFNFIAMEKFCPKCGAHR